MIGVIYLARGVDPNWQKRIERFVTSYKAHPAGITHQLYVIYKEFAPEDLDTAIGPFMPLGHKGIFAYNGFNSYAGGSFLEASNHVEEELICCLGSTSEIMHDVWLKKLYDGFNQPTVGVACCTGSYGFIHEFFPELTYPNPHIRNLSFLMPKRVYQACAQTVDWTPKPGHKIADLGFEHGPNSLTRQIMAMGKIPLVVEKDYVRAPHEWGGWDGTTYRNNLPNVLVLDRGARNNQDI